jgi:hypothetical protein
MGPFFHNTHCQCDDCVPEIRLFLFVTHSFAWGRKMPRYGVVGHSLRKESADRAIDTGSWPVQTSLRTSHEFDRKEESWVVSHSPVSPLAETLCAHAMRHQPLLERDAT